MQCHYPRLVFFLPHGPLHIFRPIDAKYIYVINYVVLGWKITYTFFTTLKTILTVVQSTNMRHIIAQKHVEDIAQKGKGYYIIT